MYLRSTAPRSSTTRWRIASSSLPSCSICSSVSGRVWVLVVIGSSSWSEVDGDVADRGGDAELDLLVRFGVQVAAADVAGAAGRLELRAAEADAHAAAVLGRQPGRLGLFEQGGARVLDLDVAEAHAAGGLAVDRGGDRRRELLGVQQVADALGGVMPLNCGHQRGRSAEEGRLV